MIRAVDLFAGAGGLTLGAELAGARVVWAANHWPFAVAMHALNHPHVAHACQDLRQASWRALPEYDLLLAAPACQGHSPGSRPNRRPYHDELRATAWAVVDCAEVTRPRALVVENVPEFLEWELFPLWRAALERLGYALTPWRALATRHGVPQLRDRVLILGALGGPAPLAPAAETDAPAFGPCVEWDAPGWRPIAQAKPGAQRRIRAAQERLGARCLSQHVTGHRGVALSEPIRTITTKDQWVVVDGNVYRPLTLREYARGMSLPDTYRWPDGAARADVVKAIGNAVPPRLGRAAVRAVLPACERRAA